MSTTNSHLYESAKSPAALFELQAAEQRQKLQESVSELKERVRDRFNVESQVRQHVWPTAGVTAFVGVLLGYAVAAVFQDLTARNH